MAPTRQARDAHPSDGAWVTLLSDSGLDDSFVGMCKGVLASIAPGVRLIDICHQIAPQAVDEGAALLASAMPYLPTGVHLALVDPFRKHTVRGVALLTKQGSLLVGPDNGLLSLAWAELGGVVAAHELTNPQHWLPRPSPTFRGRDKFAPVAAHLACGLPVQRVGDAVDPDTLVRIELREPTVDDDHVHAEIRTVDHFGNLALNVRRSDLEAAGITLGDTVELRCGGKTMQVPFTASFGDVAAGRVSVCEDSFRMIMVAVNLGHAASSLRVGRGASVVVARVQAAPAGPRTPIGVYDPLPTGPVL